MSSVQLVSKERLLKVILSPIVSEKSTRAADKNRQIVFKVACDATKPEIQEAVERLFKVKVMSVQTLNIAGKTKRRGKITGQRSDWKKAYVSLEPGFDIDFSKIEKLN